MRLYIFIACNYNQLGDICHQFHLLPSAAARHSRHPSRATCGVARSSRPTVWKLAVLKAGSSH